MNRRVPIAKQPLMRHVATVRRFDVSVDGQTVQSTSYGPGTALTVEQARARASTFTNGLRAGLALAERRA